MIEDAVIQRTLDAALRTGGDFAEVFVEDKRSSSAVLDDGKVEELNSSRDRGAGIRVVVGETTGFAHTPDLSESGLRSAADAAAAAKAALMANAADIPAKFEAEADDPVSEARPDIWMNWESFTAKAKDLENAAAALDVATLDSLKAGMGAIGGACKSCHTDFKAKR